MPTRFQGGTETTSVLQFWGHVSPPGERGSGPHAVHGAALPAEGARVRLGPGLWVVAEAVVGMALQRPQPPCPLHSSHLPWAQPHRKGTQPL